MCAKKLCEVPHCLFCCVNYSSQRQAAKAPGEINGWEMTGAMPVSTGPMCVAKNGNCLEYLLNLCDMSHSIANFLQPTHLHERSQKGWMHTNWVPNIAQTLQAAVGGGNGFSQRLGM